MGLMSEGQCPIVAYIHCKRCVSVGNRDKVAVGFDASQNVVVWCEACDSLIVKFEGA